MVEKYKNKQSVKKKMIFREKNGTICFKIAGEFEWLKKLPLLICLLVPVVYRKDSIHRTTEWQHMLRKTDMPVILY
jgi:hypothetical protein